MLQPVSNSMCMSDPSTMLLIYAVKVPLLEVKLYTSELLCSVFFPPLEGTVGLRERDRFCNLSSGAGDKLTDAPLHQLSVVSLPIDILIHICVAVLLIIILVISERDTLEHWTRTTVCDVTS